MIRTVLWRSGYALLIGLAALAAWRIVAIHASDSLIDDEPHRALAWDTANPPAWLALAQRQLQTGDTQQAAASARQLLHLAPLQADAFAIIAQAAEAGGDSAAAHRLFALAVRRAPRDEYARAWMIGTQLHDGDYPAALRNVDILFNIAPVHESTLMPLLARAADADAKFAAALGRFLGTGPTWRGGMLDELLAHATLPAVDAVFDALSTSTQGLDDADAGRWYTHLEDAGRWDEAYSRWIGRERIAAGSSVPAVWNGNFERPATGIGFDWVMRGEPGVSIERIPVAGGRGAHVAEVTFLGRRANDIGFSQLLLLAPGAYRLSFRARAEDLRSDQGMQWTIRCLPNGPVVAGSPHLGGSFDWRDVAVELTIRAAQCPAQRLALVNPGAGGAAKIVSGKIWFADFQIRPVSPQSTENH